MRSKGATFTLLLVFAMGILSLISYQAASARCAPEDIENGVYCGRPETSQPFATNNTPNILFTLLIMVATIGGFAVFFFAKTKRIETKL
jgi:hypothetical protein